MRVKYSRIDSFPAFQKPFHNIDNIIERVQLALLCFFIVEIEGKKLASSLVEPSHATL